MKYAALMATCLAAATVSSIAVPAALERSNDDALGSWATPAFPVIQYDGPLYTMTDEDKAALRYAHETNTDWEVPASMPQITLEEGTILDLGHNSTSDLTKRSGKRTVGAFGGYGCTSGTEITVVQNFGCAGACISLNSRALSGRVQQEYHSNPYPTMDVYTGTGCRGSRLQHFGVQVTDSCTNTNNCCGYQSFIAYYNC